MRFYRVKLGSVYWTNDGTVTGRPLKVSIEGIAGLLTNYNGAVYIAMDGTPHLVETVTSGRGRELQITAAFIPTALLNSLVAQITTSLSTRTAMTLELTNGALGDFTIDVLPGLPEPISGGTQFSNGIARDVTFRFVRA